MCHRQRDQCLGSPRKCCPSWFPRWAGHGTHQSDCTDSGVTSCIPVLCAAGQPSLDGCHTNPANTSLLKKGVYLLHVGVVRQLTGIATHSPVPPVFRKECLLVSPYLYVGLQGWQQNTGSGASSAVIQGENLGGYHWTSPFRRIPEGFPRREREILWDTELLK